MDPHYEQRLREEVIYLHSLWHQGPPTPHLHTLPPSHPHIQPCSTHSKKTEKSKKRKNQTQPAAEDSGIEWPCPPASDPSPEEPSVWPVLTKTPTNLPPSPKQQAWLIANQSQFKALKAVNDFFQSISDSDTDGDDDDDGDDDEEGEGSELGFFAKLFEEDGELREYYVKNCENGEFTCLVCSGVGKSKKFKDCIALVQHTITIAKTKKKAHRAYGKVVCNVLGWDIDKLPSIVSQITEKRNALLKKSGEEKEEVQANSDNATKDLAQTVKDNNDVDTVKDSKDEEIRGGMESIDGEEVLDNGGNAVDNGESVVSESAQFVSDPNGRAEDLSKVFVEGMQDNKVISPDTVEPRKGEDDEPKEGEDGEPKEGEDGEPKEGEDGENTDAVVGDSKESQIQN